MAVLLIGTLDTKGLEVGYVRDRLRADGIEVQVADAGVLGPPLIPADISREAIFAAAAVRFGAVIAGRDRGKAIELAAKGIEKIATQLYREGKLSGVIALGGSAGTAIGTAAMRALPIGVPKLMVSTVASGQMQPYVGSRDVTMVYSVVDLSGINRISRLILDNAASAMTGMVRGIRNRSDCANDKPVIAATMFGVTTPCVEAARAILEAAGYEVLVFHATGSGGRTMEGLIRDGLIAGVLDITTTELADELAGGILSAGPDRLTAAALVGVPQVISVGALDMVNFGPPESVPDRYCNRLLHRHNPHVTLMRTLPDEMDRLGKGLAEKASAASGATAVLLPLRGVSAIDAEGQPFWWPEADEALFTSIRNWMSPAVDVVEYDLHINDPRFSKAAAEKLLSMLAASVGVTENAAV